MQSKSKGMAEKARENCYRKICSLALLCDVPIPKVEFADCFPIIPGVLYAYGGQYYVDSKTIRLSPTPPEMFPTLTTAIHEFIHYYVDLKTADNSELTELAITNKEEEIEKLSKIIMRHPKNAKGLLDVFLKQIQAEKERLLKQIGPSRLLSHV